MGNGRIINLPRYREEPLTKPDAPTVTLTSNGYTGFTVTLESNASNIDHYTLYYALPTSSSSSSNAFSSITISSSASSVTRTISGSYGGYGQVYATVSNALYTSDNSNIIGRWNSAYNIKFYGNEGTTTKGGTSYLISASKYYGRSTTLNGAFYRKGYKQGNWNTSADGTGTTYTIGSTYSTNASLTLYAQWSVGDTVPAPTVTITSSGYTGFTYTIVGTNKAEKFNITIKKYSPYNTATAEKTTVTVGTAVNSQCSGTITESEGSLITIEATEDYWEAYSSTTGRDTKYNSSYTVSYNANGGSSAPSSQSKYYNRTLTLRTITPKREYYTFSKWNTNSGGTGTNYNSGESYTANASTTLYAQWTFAPVNLSAATIYLKNSSYKCTGSAITGVIDYVTCGGKTLTYNTDYTTSYSNNTNPGTATVTITGKGNYTGTKSKTFTITAQTLTITYYKNDGGSSTTSNTYTQGNSNSLRTINWTRSGYTALGWSKSSTATTASYSGGQKITDSFINSNAPSLNLYVVWKKN